MRFLHLPILMSVFVMPALIAHAQETAAKGSARETALAWLDKFEQQQILFHADDLKALREKLKTEDEADVANWLEKTRQSRAALDSPEWQSTRTWFKQFLKVQAYYSDEQIGKLQEEMQDAAKNDPVKLKELLGDIESHRQRLAQNSKTSAAMRQQQLQLVEAYKRDAIAQRSAPARAGGTNITPPSGTTPRRARVRQRPLVSSMDVARASVMQSFWGPWGF